MARRDYTFPAFSGAELAPTGPGRPPATLRFRLAAPRRPSPRPRTQQAPRTSGYSGADVAAQCISAGLIDEIFVHLVPVLLGGGRPLFTMTGPPAGQAAQD